ncbi:hypothetical protein C0581_03335 [Candidatus Parcubacteria bacterium]|nr:MAG: hypothetical protein C0581_03335 [Candidatus Parcubacteria bacterium]
MRLVDALSLSTRMFKTRPMRTFLTILGVGVGIGAVLFLVSLGYGLQSTVLGKITTADSLLSLDVSQGDTDLIQMDSFAIEKIARIDHVEEVSPVLVFSAQLTNEDLTSGTTVYGVKESYFRLSGVEPVYGSIFEETPVEQLDQEAGVVVSSAVATLFNMEPENIIGTKILLDFFIPYVDEDGGEDVRIMQDARVYNVVGVVQDDTEIFVYVPSLLVDNMGVNMYVETKVKVASTEFLESVRQEIIGMGFFVSAMRDTIEQVEKVFRIIQIALGFFGLIALIVSSIGMFNTMTVMLLERTNEIGIMRSIGLRRRDIKILFLVESSIMGLLGGVVGIVIGYVGGEIANILMNALARNFGGQAVDLFVTPMWFVVVILLFSVFIGFFTGVFPARRAGKLNPLEALRYK